MLSDTTRSDLCYICLLRGISPVADAVTMVKGTAVCNQHIKHIANYDLLTIMMKEETKC